MSSLSIIAPNYAPDHKQATYLIASCDKFGHDLHLYGEGKLWPGHGASGIDGALETIKGLRSEVILYTDAHDAFICATPEDILERFNTTWAPIVISAEKNCYPKPELASKYPSYGSPFCFVNAGGWMGYREPLIAALSEMQSGDHGDDQLAWTEWFLSHPRKAELDTWCRIFQCMANAEMLASGTNAHTGTRPAVLHFNGRSPGIEEWYGRLVC